MRTIAVLIGLLSLHLTLLNAQSTELRPGARVRIEAPGTVAGHVTGTVLTRSGDTLTIGGPELQPLAISMSAITSLEISRGNSRTLGAGRGLEWGIPIGLGIGGLLAASSANCTYRDGKSTCSSNDRAGIISICTLSGVLYGAIIGAIAGKEAWEEFDTRPHASLRAINGKPGVAMSFAF